jgi:excisionase family DNA binding protein
MSQSEDAREKLGTLIEKVRKRGDAELADELRSVLASLKVEASAPAEDLLSTGEAAGILGVRSINTVKRWAREGLLEGFRVGGRVKISRQSVAAFRDHPVTKEQQAFERRVDEVMAPFDVSAEEAREIADESMTGLGAVPWDRVAAQRG